MSLKSLEDRQKFANALAEYVASHATVEYNLFIFGSFLTEDYVEGKSDIDVAVFTLKDKIELGELIRDYVKNNSTLSCDILFLHPGASKCYVEIAPLLTKPYTSYAVADLNLHKIRLIRELQEEVESRRVYKNLFERVIQRN